MRLMEAIEKYVGRKQANGIGFEKGAKELRSFCRQARNPSLDCITTGNVVRFLNGPRTSPVTWRKKYSLLRNFFEFWNSRGEMPGMQLPPPLPPVCRTFVPYIYSREEIQRLLTAIRDDSVQAARVIDGRTMATLIVTLYGTGAMLGEILSLSPPDVDLNAGFITVRCNRFNRLRRIRLAPTCAASYGGMWTGNDGRKLRDPISF